MDFFVAFSNGTRPNYFPAAGMLPSLADFRDASLSLTFRPMSRLLFDQAYLYSHLGARAESGDRGTIFDNHIFRSRVNYQFTRELSVRGILDYNAVLSNPARVALTISLSGARWPTNEREVNSDRTVDGPVSASVALAAWSRPNLAGRDLPESRRAARAVSAGARSLLPGPGAVR